MITHIRMKNFKSWQDSGEVKLAPLTGFFGTNSSGKSSLLQMLLLLKQTVGTNKILFFGNENSLVNLGNFREVIHGHEEEKSLELEFGCKLKAPFKIEIYGKKPNEQNKNVSVFINNFTFNTVIHEVGSNLNVESFRYGFESYNVSAIEWKKGSLFQKDLYGEQQAHGGRIVLSCYGVPGSSPSPLLMSLSSAFEDLFSHVYYLGPTRVDPQRFYIWNGGHPEHPGEWGNQAIDALLSARVRNLKTLHEAEEVPIEQRVSYWLQEMSLAHSFSLDWTGMTSSERGYEVRIQKTPLSPPVTLVDMGYGLTQFLPVLVLCYYAPEGSTLILEQPGIHLHPKVQSQLADLLIEVVTERKLQILIESHSEHLLTRLQLRIAEEKIPAGETALYFCENDNGVSTIKSLDVDELGNIKNWPQNFFGNVRGDLVKMTREQMKRQKKAEG